MRILIATFTYPPESNGVSHVVEAHATGLSKRGHEITVVTATNMERDLKQFEKEGIKVFQFDVKGNGNIKIGYSGEIKRYQEFIANFNADVILFHCWQIWSTDLAIPMLSFNKAKKILVSHGVSVSLNTALSYLRFENWLCRRSYIRLANQLINWLCWRLYAWKIPKMLKAFDHIVFLSNRKDKNRYYDVYLAQKLGLTNFSIIPHGTYPMKNKYNSNWRNEFKISSKYMALYVSDYNPLKNQKIALEAFAESGVKDTTMVFIGSKKNKYFTELEGLAKKLQVSDKVLFLDGLSREKIIEAYLSADIFIFSSLTETQPLVILDAIRAGIPFISTDVGCVSNLPGGIVVRSKSEMAQKIKFLIEDEILRERLSIDGKNACERTYSWEIVMEKYESLLIRITQEF